MIKKIAVIGTGVIGTGWIIRFLAHNKKVIAFDKDLKLEKSTVVILRWIALVGQLITIYIVHFFIEFNLPLILCSITIFFGGVTNIFIQFNLQRKQLNNTESTILLFYDLRF